ncbi:NADP-dependent oxidoreductase domain-containing protein [Mycena olivaceomarginata]|nr:NADP-dependent oxidoreductase domain-containing protein [Mycena olivaceomarginata]
MSFGKALTLSSGTPIPQLALGTWLAEPNEVGNAVEVAVRHGYRHLDCATIYENHAEVGAALKKVVPSVVPREALFITSKLPRKWRKQLDETLKDLGVEYLDLYLMHWPVAFVPGKGLYPAAPDEGWPSRLGSRHLPCRHLEAMIALSKSKVRNIGVSNFTIAHLDGIIAATGVVPTVLQIEAHPLLLQDDLVAFCKDNNIQITAYSPLGNNRTHIPSSPYLTKSPLAQCSAKRNSSTTPPSSQSPRASARRPAQVLIAWGVHRGYTVNVKSVRPERVKANFQQLALTNAQYAEITALGNGRHVRFNIPYRYEPGWDISLFDEEAEKEATYKVKIA